MNPIAAQSRPHSEKITPSCPPQDDVRSKHKRSSAVTPRMTAREEARTSQGRSEPLSVLLAIHAVALLKRPP
ncbi:hypothetical protein IQ06DRAFT_150451 [Phaeosphaeriaceae sp. SRC1lsM3a]|nr:hypothetical protein IQ06DRAFT_150451 [Stagonospora sp. SRC1lsM3a]